MGVSRPLFRGRLAKMHLQFLGREIWGRRAFSAESGREVGGGFGVGVGVGVGFGCACGSGC